MRKIYLNQRSFDKIKPFAKTHQLPILPKPWQGCSGYLVRTTFVSLLLCRNLRSISSFRISPQPFGSRTFSSSPIMSASSASDVSSSGPGSSSRVRVVSYNVLSSKLARPSHFTHSDPEHLEYEYRLSRILSKLEEEMNRGFGTGPTVEVQNDTDDQPDDTPKSAESNNAPKPDEQPPPPTIFCLQEVCYTFASSLHVFFAQRGYHFVTCLYGRKFNGYMGVAIAYPTTHFETINVDISRLSDVRNGGWPRPPLPPSDVTDASGDAVATSTAGEKSDKQNIINSGDAVNENITKHETVLASATTADGNTANENKYLNHPPEKAERLRKTIQKLKKTLQTFTAQTIESTCAFVREFIDKRTGVKFRLALGLPPLSGENQTEDEIEPWEFSEKKFNSLLTVVLRHHHQNNDGGSKLGSDGVFSISNYHMPCAFYAPPVMNIHAEMVARRVQDFARTTWNDLQKEAQNDSDAKDELDHPTMIPYILAGDFNILPDSPHYQLLTKGTLDKTDPTFPPSKYGMEWQIGSLPMDSAYSLCNESNSEPEFTNFAQIKDEDPFIATLDYIFLSKSNDDDGHEMTNGGWKTRGVKQLPSKEKSGGPFPSGEEPSDHLVIAADLELVSLS